MPKNEKFLPIVPIAWKPLPSSKVIIDDVNQELYETYKISHDEFKNQIIVVPVKSNKKDRLSNIALLGKIKLVKIPSKKDIIEIDIVKRVKLSNKELENEIIDNNPKVNFSSYTNYNDKYGTEESEEKLVNTIFKLLDESESLQIDPQKIKILDEVELGSSEIADILASIMMLNEEQYIKFLKEKSVENKLNIIIDILVEKKQENSLDGEIEKELQARLEKSQREYILREKINTIKRMLGDTNDIDKFIDTSREFLKNSSHFPKNVEEKINEEINKLSVIPASSSDSNVLRTWIEWTISLPWNSFEEEKIDLNEVKKTLDSHHSGLNDIKERILEYLAVKKMKSNIKGDILCFVGPPGVGKSTLAKSISEAINRKFVRISLGGVKDESEIRGHRRTYVGAQPGRIIQSMKNAKTSNPIFLLDEIEKMGYDFKGDPSGALLEVLDPEQNDSFSDHYLEIPYDLSNVLFIATANDISLIPTPLRDRMEIIELSSYTKNEKIDIAKNNLIPKQLKKHGITDKEFSISDVQISKVIDYYTFEAGVRNLERLISKLIRKTVFNISMDSSIDKVNINNEILIKYLGNSKIEPTKKPSKNSIGVVNGMAFTPYGGDIIPIEAVSTKGKGKIQITGNLKEVMKESAYIAFSHLKAFSSDYKLDFDKIQNTDIYLHALSGATPKDGPSAGITMALAMYSALTNKKVNKDISMTGEIGLRGQVLPIGGLKEKSMGAINSGIKDIIIPFDNQKDLEEIPEEIKSQLRYHPVKNFSEVLKLALV